ncbi:MAG TPA: nuclear transport factor 2 family protein [Pyrinomonadaceae bacterium]|nr:nuclear transport factor 2 family protein [Pyrinomonadaceae bacterium]
MKRSILMIVIAGVVASVSSCATGPETATSSSTPSATSAPASSENIEQAVTKLENERVQALLRNDTAFIERVYADDYVVTGANGIVRTRAQVVADLKSGVQKSESITNDDVKVHVHGDTAVVTGRTTQKGEYKGQPSISPVLFTRVYARRGGQWQLVANHTSSIPQK